MNRVVRVARWLAFAGALFVGASVTATNLDPLLRNDIAVTFTATPSDQLSPGEPIDFVLTASNLGDVPVTFVVLRSSFFLHEIQAISQQDCILVTTVADGDDFFVYYFSWYVAGAVGGPPLEAGESRTCHFQMALTSEAPAVFPFTFGYVSDSPPDSNPDNDQATVILRRGDIAPVAIPMLSPAFLLILAIGLAIAACHAGRRRDYFP